MSIDHVNLDPSNLDRAHLILQLMSAIYELHLQCTGRWQFSLNFFSILKCRRIIRIHLAWTGDKNPFRLDISDLPSTNVTFLM